MISLSRSFIVPGVIARPCDRRMTPPARRFGRRCGASHNRLSAVVERRLTLVATRIFRAGPSIFDPLDQH
jgi:hypothetical protein